MRLATKHKILYTLFMKTVVGLVGPIASGKGTVVKIFEERGFASSSLSDRIREEITKRGQEITRQSLTEVSNELRNTFGNDILAKRISEIIERSRSDKFVIDAIRNPYEIMFLKQKYNARIIAVTAEQKKRFEHFVNRGTNTKGITTWEDFKELDNSELTGKYGEHSQRVNDCIKIADLTIENNGTIDELKEKVGKFISSS